MTDTVTELEREKRISNAFLELESTRRELTECRQAFQNLKYLYVRIVMAYGTIKIPKNILEDISAKGTITRENNPETGEAILTFKKANGKGNGGK